MSHITRLSHKRTIKQRNWGSRKLRSQMASVASTYHLLSSEPPSFCAVRQLGGEENQGTYYQPAGEGVCGGAQGVGVMWQAWRMTCRRWHSGAEVDKNWGMRRRIQNRAWVEQRWCWRMQWYNLWGALNVSIGGWYLLQWGLMEAYNRKADWSEMLILGKPI